MDEHPGWKEWRRHKIVYTLHFDDPVLPKEPQADFVFPDEIERQHNLVMAYLELEQIAFALKDCEFYFRRYPFKDLPVSRYTHVSNVCEMYFSRVYEFKSRIKNYFKSLSKVPPHSPLNVGALVKLYEKEFDQELRERNAIHHHRRFSDLAIDRLFVTADMPGDNDETGWRQEHLAAYRRLTREWVGRVRRCGEKMDSFLEGIADITIKNCDFLRAHLPDDAE